MKFLPNLKPGLRDLEGWDYAWLSVLSNEGAMSNKVEVGSQVALNLESFNFHTQICEIELKDKFTENFIKTQKICGVESNLTLGLRLVKIVKVGVEIEVEGDLEEDLQVLDFKVYHPVVEAISNLK